ncbi:hypothetical protein RHSIM_Rhsim02G0230300 [Rhododendron simsii]|uniref:Uncharacterized protein n=1 Tax=Rhododendron simsii TaxID=118357 RepID=A0A834H9B3_RHOSS|nr:hypothetical protein RHSIM_Rhsim02G0230300 [Rhododendron simsii]
MVESIAATSLLGHRPVCGGYHFSGFSSTKKLFGVGRIPVPDFISGKVVWTNFRRLGVKAIKAQAMELTKEVYSSRKEERTIRGFQDGFDIDADRKPGLWPPENKADKPSLHNPLLRQERMGCGWLGAIFEWEGVLIEDNPDLENQAWITLSEEEGQSPLLGYTLRRIEGMKNEQAISEVFCWSRDPAEVKRLASRKEEIYQALQGGIYTFRSGSHEFVNVLMHYKIPMALVATRPRKTLERAIGEIGIKGVFTVIVTAEDVHRGKPDPEMFLYASQQLNFIPERCIVFGNSNLTVEAAHDARMKCVAVASNHPVYELGAADLVVSRLDELSVVDLKNLADIEMAEFGSSEPELEMETEEDDDESYSASSTAAGDDFW